jgi:hypothetical protein
VKVLGSRDEIKARKKTCMMTQGCLGSQIKIRTTEAECSKEGWSLGIRIFSHRNLWQEGEWPGVRTLF